MTMTREATLALLSAGAYWDIRDNSIFSDDQIDQSNRAPLPEGWRLLPEDVSGSGGTMSAIELSGFSARAYQNIVTGEIVISYAGTEFGKTWAGMGADFVSANIPLAIGQYGQQALLAATYYQNIKTRYGTDNISFTGHSLGGGLASVMAVWFDRPAYVYAPAPFANSANETQNYIPVLSETANQVMLSVRKELGDSVDESFRHYDPSQHFEMRKKMLLPGQSEAKCWKTGFQLFQTSVG